MKEDRRVVGITAGTPTVMGFTEDKRQAAGYQFVDVGIAEEHAVALASGIAKAGGNPYSVCIVHSSNGLTTNFHKTSASTVIRPRCSSFGDHCRP